jgi:hypothetical protein
MAEKSIRLQVIEQVAALMTAAFAFIAALAWNQAISAMVTQFIGAASGWVALLVYAVIVTIIAVLAAIYITKMAAKVKSSEALVGKKAEK